MLNSGLLHSGNFDMPDSNEHEAHWYENLTRNASIKGFKIIIYFSINKVQKY